MGEADYYLKAVFPSNESLATALPEIKKFLLEGIAAHEWWQEHRDLEFKGARRTFWNHFRAWYPRVYEYLQGSGHADGDCNNELAGVLKFGTVDNLNEFFQKHYPDDKPYVTTVHWFLYEANVWHLATWDFFCNHLKRKFGATCARWISSEDIEPYSFCSC